MNNCISRSHKVFLSSCCPVKSQLLFPEKIKNRFLTVSCWFQSCGVWKGQYEITCTNPCVRRNPLLKWCSRLTLQTQLFVWIFDRDSGCIARLFPERCFTAVGVDNFLTVALIFLSSISVCHSSVSRDLLPMQRTAFDLVDDLSVGVKYDKCVCKWCQIMFCSYPLPPVLLDRIMVVLKPSQWKCQMRFVILVLYITVISRWYAGIHLTELYAWPFPSLPYCG